MTQKKYYFLKFFLIFVLILFLIIKFVNLKIFSNNYTLIRFLLNNSNHYVSPNYTYKDRLSDLIMYITDYDFRNPINLLRSSYEFKNVLNEELSEDGSDLYEVYNYEPEVIDSLPLVYIYNTHQKEEYIGNDLVLNPTVYSASYLLHDELLKRGINSIVEDSDITEFLINNNLNYDDSYIASRVFLENAIKKYDSIKLFVDLHRDALDHDSSTVYFNDKAYSKILFVVGVDYENYQPSLDLALHLNDLILNKYSYLTRGVLTKSGPLVNGVYNQDLSNNIILLEVGGNESNIEEVSNTICLISDVIYDYLGE